MDGIFFEVPESLGDDFIEISLEDRLAISERNLNKFKHYLLNVIENDKSIKCTSILPEILDSINSIPLVKKTTYSFTYNDYDIMTEIRDSIYELVDVLQRISSCLNNDDLRVLDDFIPFYLKRIRINCEDEYPNVETAPIRFQLASMSDLVSSQIEINFESIINMLLELKSKIESKRHILYEKFLSINKEDEYGFIDEKPWIKARSEFSEKCILNVTGLSVNEVEPMTVIAAAHSICVLKYIPDCIDIYYHNNNDDVCNDKTNQINYSPDSRLFNKESESSYERGINYEKKCKEQFGKLGWEVSETSKTGDKGVDIIAVKRGFRIAIQCKNWSSNIGSSAVQEIYTGTRIYKCDFGVLMTESPLTGQASAMARDLGIISASIEDISHLEVLIIKNMQSKFEF